MEKIAKVKTPGCKVVLTPIIECSRENCKMLFGDKIARMKEPTKLKHLTVSVKDVIVMDGIVIAKQLHASVDVRDSPIGKTKTPKTRGCSVVLRRINIGNVNCDFFCIVDMSQKQSRSHFQYFLFFRNI